MAQFWNLPQPAQQSSLYDQYSAMQPSQPEGSFVWGEGGQQLTPDEIAQRRQVAQALIQGGMDYSPVGSWSQGLARVAQGLMGAIDEKQADKAAGSNASANQAIVQSLLSPDGGDKSNAALTALTSPYSDQGTRAAAQLVYKANNRAPVNNDTVNDYNFIAGKLGQDAANGYLRNFAAGPPIVVRNPDGTITPISRAEFATDNMGGGDPTSGTGPGASPATPPANFMSLGQYQTLRQSLGNGFSGWQSQNQVPVLVNSQEEMGSLPPGTLVVSPDGRTGRTK